MKLSELIEELQVIQRDGVSGDPEVHFSYDYGDHTHTQVAPKVRNVEVTTVVRSEYHDMPRISVEDGAVEAVVLS
jgi:hypothetical protein